MNGGFICPNGGPHYFIGGDRCVCGAEEGYVFTKRSEHERLTSALAASQALAESRALALATMREALSDLCNVVEDARSIGEMQGENFAMSPWSDLERAAPRYLPLLSQHADAAATLAGPVLEAADALMAWAERDWREDHSDICGCDTQNDDECLFPEHRSVETYRRARAALRGLGRWRGDGG